MKVALILITLSLAPFTHDLHLSGTVRFQDKSKAEKLAGLYFFVKNQNHILAGDSLDTEGYYSLSVPTENLVGALDFYYAGNGFDTTFVKSISQFNSQISEVYFVLE